ncbi:hypothetical protein ACWKT5_23940 [Streptomyces avermitilis]
MSRRLWRPDLGELFVTRNTAVDDSHPPVSTCVIRKPFLTLSLTAQALRIVDGARHTEAPWP